jgi:hypothetical protein
LISAPIPALLVLGLASRSGSEFQFPYTILYGALTMLASLAGVILVLRLTQQARRSAQFATR